MATKAKKPIPDGYHSVTPALVVRNAARLVRARPDYRSLASAGM